MNSEKIEQFFIDFRLLNCEERFIDRKIHRLMRGPHDLSSPVVDGMPHGNSVMNVENDCTELVTLTNRKYYIDAVIDECDALLKDVSLQNQKQAIILKEFYIEGNKIKDIAKKLEITPEYASMLKQKAEKNLNSVLTSKYQTDFNKLVLEYKNE